MTLEEVVAKCVEGDRGWLVTIASNGPLAVEVVQCIGAEVVRLRRENQELITRMAFVDDLHEAATRRAEMAERDLEEKCGHRQP